MKCTGSLYSRLARPVQELVLTAREPPGVDTRLPTQMASKGDSTDLGHDPSTHSLTKLKLPQPVTYTKLQTTKRELNEILQRDQQASSLQHKLQTITDQPTWNAFVSHQQL